MDLYEGTLPDIDPQRPLAWLEWCLLQSKSLFGGLVRGLVPFTLGPAGASVLCFDSREGDAHGDSPIAIIHYENGHPLDQIALNALANRQVFDGFRSYLSFLRDWLVYSRDQPAMEFIDWLARHNKTMPPRCYFGMD